MNKSGTERIYNIAGVYLKLINSGFPLCLTDSNKYVNFREVRSEGVAYSIKVIDGLPEFDLEGKVVLSSEDLEPESNKSAHQYFHWNIVVQGLSIYVVLLDSENLDKTVAILEINKDRKWFLFVDCSFDLFAEGFNPFIYPLGPLIQYYLMIDNDACLMHAAAVRHKGEALVFSGKSGVGKSTMAGLWKGLGSVINDDKIIIKREKEQFFVYNSPRYPNDVPVKLKLRKIYLLKQSKKNYSKRLGGAAALSGIMAFCIQHLYNRELVVERTQFLADVVQAVEVFELGFKPDHSIVDFILNDDR
ncbi:MAG: hypothetical protein C0594_08125 [Marinilabiliales bacterium]|nr:MAG: hypothetical protein C0594_08125 [Marinilabiliales bacterium]